MCPDSSAAGPPHNQGEVIVRLPETSGQVGALGAAAPQSIMSFSAFAVEVDSAPVVRTIVLDLIDRRRWFAALSLPGDVWVVSVKSADQDVLEAILNLRQIKWRPPQPELMRFGG